MISTSDDYKTAIMQDGRSQYFKADVTLKSGATLSLDNTNVQNVQIHDSTSEKEKFSVGKAVPQEIDLDIANYDGAYSDTIFEGAVITAYFGLELPAGIEWVQRGIFTVSSAKKQSSLIKVIAYDNMQKFDKPYKDITSAVYPLDLKEILQDLCNKCGVELHTTDFLNWNYSVAARPTDESITGLEIISYVAELAGCWARIDNTGGLTIGWYDLKATYIPQFLHPSSCTVAENDIAITGVEVKPNGSDSVYLDGVEGYIISIEDNPLVQELPDTLTKSIGDKLIGFKFRPLEIGVICNPAVEAGDTISVVDSKGNIYTTILSNISFTFTDTATYSADAESASERQIADPLGTKIKSVVDVSTKNLSDIVYFSDNDGIRELTSTLTEIIRINFTAAAQANPIFNAEINFVATVAGTIEFSYLIDNVSYIINPKQTVSVGNYIIHLFLPLIGMKGNQAHSISVSMKSADAAGYIDKSALLASVNGQGLTASSNMWSGVIEVSEKIAKVTAKIGISYKPLTATESTISQTPEGVNVSANLPRITALIGLTIKSITDTVSAESVNA